MFLIAPSLTVAVDDDQLVLDSVVGFGTSDSLEDERGEIGKHVTPTMDIASSDDIGNLHNKFKILSPISLHQRSDYRSRVAVTDSR